MRAPRRFLVCAALAAALSIPASGVLAARGAATAHALVRTAHNAKLGQILMNAHGMTLYTFNPDKHGKSTCYGACATYWPPVVLPRGESVAAACQGVHSGSFAATVRTGGARQLTYNGKPLYTFKGDTKPGQTNGQGVQKVWWVATVKAASGGGSGSGGGHSGW